ncbi:MAG: hypothetical protein M3083_00770 [Actinomycetota bacterium]|nr:hypothetical protein [Actinomycetota bacterium]MDQ6944778.1 hypothetical protein [Actinomycetota bacterium]
MIDVTPTLFVGDPSDARKARVKSQGISTVSLTWTPTPTQALAVIRAGGNALLPRDSWQAGATIVLAALGCNEAWIARCVRLADYRDRNEPVVDLKPG